MNSLKENNSSQEHGIAGQDNAGPCYVIPPCNYKADVGPVSFPEVTGYSFGIQMPYQVGQRKITYGDRGR